MPESEASGESVLDEPVDTDRLGVQVPAAPAPDDDLDHPLTAGARDDERPFDAFNTSTWRFDPAPPPWYRTRSAALGLAAVGIALVALVVAVVLLAFRNPPDDAVPTHDTSTAPATTAPRTVTATSSALPPPPPPPPPPPAAEPSAGGGGDGPRVGTRPTRKPEINVTRSPYSVSPQPRGR